MTDCSNEQADEVVARAAKIDEQMVQAYVRRLKAAGTDRDMFMGILAELDAARDASAATIMAIADAYLGPGPKQTSKKAALAKLSKRIVEIIRDAKKVDLARTVRHI